MIFSPQSPPYLSKLSTLANLRDIGGLETVDGRQLRTGLVFRCDSLQDITAAEAAVLVDEIGIRTVIDLRIGRESIREGRGPLVNHPIQYVNVPLIDVDGPKGPPGRVLLDFYIDHLDNDANLPVAVQTLAHLADRPVLAHCAAGKDRTGLLMLLVELLAGVRPDEAERDFMRTADNMERIRARLRTWAHYAHNMETLSPEIYECEPHSVAGALDHLVAKYGTAEAWAEAKGIPDTTVALLRDRLVEPS
ncbi:MAG: tyrosine-protein phosphatase [Acidimicrobiia bacterium]|uniref:tyrosine-protein phosphatase n=1 Tax=Nocardioides sp. Soil777 TaxID=1736409 RepID=UPI0009EBCF35|nr:tyrosine-protein phosphatase [Nocardioides sp. Soil777]MDP3983515.1 tyrosine-protein phosphatase [Acidimicrobiia bacterium]